MDDVLDWMRVPLPMNLSQVDRATAERAAQLDAGIPNTQYETRNQVQERGRELAAIETGNRPESFCKGSLPTPPAERKRWSMKGEKPVDVWLASCGQ